MRNTGKPSEDIFEAYFASLGKSAFVHRFVDAAEVAGRTGKIGQTRAAPSDYLVTYGSTFYAEVKSTEHETRFAFSLLRSSQTAAARQVIAAGGIYNVFIHSLMLNAWYCVPYSRICAAKDDGKKSLTWEELAPCRISFAR